MRAITKIAVFAAAVLITLAGFNLIASKSAMEVFNAGKLGGHEMVVTAQALSPVKVHPPS